MKDIELHVSSLIESQFPSFYKEEGPTFIAFVKAYFEWLEQSGDINQIAHETRNLPSYRDIDSTLERFIENFQYKYLQGVPREYSGDRRTLQKHIKEIYSSKGSPVGLQLLFRLLFNEDIDIYIPGDDVLKPSDSDFVAPRYLEMEYSPLLPLYTNKQVFGRISGASAIINEYRTFIKENTRFDILYVSNLRGTFEAGEEIINKQVLEENNLIVSDSPKVRGSLSDIVVIDGGIGFRVGDTFDVDGLQNGSDAKAVVVDVRQRAGFVTFDIRNRPFGFSNTANLEEAGFSESIYPEYMPQIDLERSSADLSVSVDVSSANLTVGRTYTIKTLGTTDWEAAGYVGTPVVGGTFVCIASQPGTGIAYFGSGTFVEKEIVRGLSSGATGILLTETVGEAGRTLNLSRVYGNFRDTEIVVGDISGAMRMLSGDDLISEASFKIGHLTDTLRELLCGVKIERASNNSVTWIRQGTDIIINHPYHCLRDNDEIVIKSSSDETALPVTNGENTTVTLTDFEYTSNSSATFITINDHMYRGSDKIIIRYCSNTDFIGSETVFPVTIIDANTISIPLVSEVETTGTIQCNDYYTVVGLDGGAESGTAIVEFTIDALNYGGWADQEVRSEPTINESVAVPPDMSFEIQQAIKFGTVEFGKIADESAKPSGLSSVFGGEGYKTNVLIAMEDPLVYGLRVKGEPRKLSGTVSISGNTVAGSSTLFTKQLSVGDEVYFTFRNIHPRVVTEIIDNTSMKLNDSFRDLDGSELSFTNEILHKVNYWGKVDIPPSLLIDDADVYGVAGFGRGAVNRLAIADSGIGFQSGEQLNLYYTKDSSKQISAYAIAQTDGKSEGYFRTNKSFLNSNKYIHDNNFYQEYSYEVQSSLPFSRYSTILKEIWHPAGISKFGRVVIKDTIENVITSEVTIQQEPT